MQHPCVSIQQGCEHKQELDRLIQTSYTWFSVKETPGSRGLHGGCPASWHLAARGSRAAAVPHHCPAVLLRIQQQIILSVEPTIASQHLDGHRNSATCTPCLLIQKAVSCPCNKLATLVDQMLVRRCLNQPRLAASCRTPLAAHMRLLALLDCPHYCTSSLFRKQACQVLSQRSQYAGTCACIAVLQ